MSKKDFWKVLAMLFVAFIAVAVYVHARVDLGMTQVQVNHHLEQWVGNMSMLSMLILSQIILAVIVGTVYKFWQHRSVKGGLE